MIGIVMGGGKGSRMKLDKEKLLIEYNQPVILNVVDSLKRSDCFTRVLVLTSPNSPKTRAFLQEKNIETVDTSGNGYAEDLNFALQFFDDDVFVCSGDMPLLDSEVIQNIVKTYDPKNTWMSILLTDNLLNSLNLKSDYSVIFNKQKCHYSGISLVNSRKISSFEIFDEQYLIFDDKRIALNLNTKSDYDSLCAT